MSTLFVPTRGLKKELSVSKWGKAPLRSKMSYLSLFEAGTFGSKSHRVKPTIDPERTSVTESLESMTRVRSHIAVSWSANLLTGEAGLDDAGHVST